jgi:hypothetical protein
MVFDPVYGNEIGIDPPLGRLGDPLLS